MLQSYQSQAMQRLLNNPNNIIGYMQVLSTAAFWYTPL